MPHKELVATRKESPSFKGEGPKRSGGGGGTTSYLGGRYRKTAGKNFLPEEDEGKKKGGGKGSNFLLLKTAFPLRAPKYRRDERDAQKHEGCTTGI